MPIPSGLEGYQRLSSPPVFDAPLYATVSDGQVVWKKKDSMLDYYVFDIEAIPYKYDEYKKLWPHSKKKPGLHAFISEVVCICFYTHTQHGDEYGVFDRRNSITEEILLRKFERFVYDHKNSVVVGYNSKNYDQPMVSHRSRIYGFEPTFPDFRSPTNVDVYDFCGGKWKGDTASGPLDQLCWSLYGEPKQDFDGSEISVLWEAQKLDEIAAKCQKDVERTNRIYLDHILKLKLKQKV